MVCKADITLLSGTFTGFPRINTIVRALVIEMSGKESQIWRQRLPVPVNWLFQGQQNCAMNCNWKRCHNVLCLLPPHPTLMLFTGSNELFWKLLNLNFSFWKSPLGEVSTVLLIATKKFYKFPGNLISHLPQNSRQICKQVFQTVLNFCSTEIYSMKSTLKKKLKTRDVWH